MPAWRFREARLQCCLSVDGCADLLQISARTVRNWEAGAVRIPYAAYKLMRVMRGGKLLGPPWRNFYIRGNRLVTPEGHSFEAGELSWWSLLVRQAREFQRIMRDRRSPKAEADGKATQLPRPPAAPASLLTLPIQDRAGEASAGLVSYSNKSEQSSINPFLNWPSYSVSWWCDTVRDEGDAPAGAGSGCRYSGQGARWAPHPSLTPLA